MKTEKELNADIIKITMMIREKYPELSKNIIEMPVTNSEAISSAISNKSLQDYYNSLVTLLKNHDETHATKQTTKI
ncbi:MAG TPA: hypothetical protein VNX01_14740 [Bacteroidia bacterium]|jgi:hypothetical protein|nr:hypothetical protein [Bacteroidia bacterium]